MIPYCLPLTPRKMAHNITQKHMRHLSNADFRRFFWQKRFLHTCFQTKVAPPQRMAGCPPLPLIYGCRISLRMRDPERSN
jgi:hypothetical protein